MNQPGKASTLANVTGYTLSAMSFILFASILFTHMAVYGFESALAGFLLEAFSWMAYVLPLYILAAGVIALFPGFDPAHIYIYLSSLIPVSLLVFLVRFLEETESWLQYSVFLRSLGFAWVIGLCIVLIALSTAGIVALRFIIFAAPPNRREAPKSSTVHPGDSNVSKESGQKLTFSVPDLPPPPFLTSVEGRQAEKAPVPATPDTLDLDSAPDLEELEPVEPAEPEDAAIPFMLRREMASGINVSSDAIKGKDDPALNEGFWDDAKDEAENRVKPALMSRVEVFADGTHADSLRVTKAAPAKTEDESLKADQARLVKKEVGMIDGIPVLSVPPAPLLKKKPARIPVAYNIPTENILTSYPDGEYWIVDDKTRREAEVLRQTLKEFNIEAEVTGIRKGPVITMFEILPAPGVRLSKIAGLCDNIALRLAASSVRIVAPIPGKHAVGIEVPNDKRSIVSFKEIVENETFKSAKMEVPVVLGKDITGEVQYIDLTQTPHLLIAGSTGSGKSVCVNSIILSILYRRSFNEVKLILIDPKIVELKLYNGIPHLLTPVITEPKKAFQALQYCICEMERRYSLLDAMGVRDIRSYNRKIVEKNMATTKLPYIVVIIDEFADLMATTGKELESTLARLAAMSRAVGIHLVLATQRPSIDVITGLIKANIPSRIAFMVASKFDSRIIIDAVGAEKLLGKGDMLFSSAWDAFPCRMQGAFVSDDEVERVVEYVKTLGEPNYIDDEIFIDDEDEDDGPSLFDEEDDDPLYEKALEIVLSQGKASASFLQRKLKIGYNRAARLVELMEEKGIVGPQQGSKPRNIMHNPEMGGMRPPSPKARYVPDFTEGDEDAGE